MKTKKVFSWDQYHERQIALRINYLGCDLKGFVQQESSNETVELEQLRKKAHRLKRKN